MESFQLGNWLVQPQLNQLKMTQGQQSISVAPKAMQLLVVLIEQKREKDNSPLSIDALIEKVWADRVVADSSVYQAVAQLRKVLGQDQEHPTYIERISGQGYRIASDVPVSLAVTKQSKKTRKPVIAIAFVLFAIVAITSMLIEQKPEQKSTSPFFESLSLADHLVEQTELTAIEQAKQLYLEVLDQAPNHVVALVGLCKTYRLMSIYGTLSEIDRDSLCQPLLEQAYKLQPNNAKVLAAMAKQALELNQLEKAESLLEQSLAINDNNAYVWHWYGRLKRTQNQVSQALIAHQKAFHLAPNNPLILRGLAYAHLNNRNLNEARKYYERSLVITPRFKNKALYDLDFYPLDATKAKSYLAWYQAYEKDYLKKYPSHKLSYVLFLLSINQPTVAQQVLVTMSEADKQQAPKDFLLYTKAALAWKNGDKEKGLKNLSQRYNLAPEQNHFVMPYLFALEQQGRSEEALTLLLKHFPNLSQQAIAKEQLGQVMLLAKLYKSVGEQQEFQQLYSKLLSFKQSSEPFSLHQQIIWSDLVNDNSNRLQLLTNQLNTGWLPDYNDSIFIEDYYSTLLKEQQRTIWQTKLNKAQSCIWQPEKSEHCNTQQRQASP